MPSGSKTKKDKEKGEKGSKGEKEKEKSCNGASAEDQGALSESQFLTTAAQEASRQNDGRIGVAIIGAGPRARYVLVPEILRNPYLKLLAVWSVSRQSAQALNAEVCQGALDVYWLQGAEKEGATLDRLLLRQEIKGVVLAVPPAAYPSLVTKCCKAGKDILSEAPVGVNLKGAGDVVNSYFALVQKMKKDKEASKHSKTPFSWHILQPLASESFVTKLLTVEKDIGDLRHGELMVSIPLQAQTRGNVNERMISSGNLLMYVIASHVGMIRKLLGEVSRVVGRVAQLTRHVAGPDTLAGMLFVNQKGDQQPGQMVQVSVSFTFASQTEVFRLHLQGERGALIVSLDDLKRGYIVKRDLGTYEHPMLNPTTGVQFNFENWADYMRGVPRNLIDPHSHVVDLTVAEALLTSQGVPVAIR
uniref:Gfo/Idh/MocA-like oxidoreductase N-terminal domain-containing protein n=1 Tax=Chromera velia CCMP2878 TaxID=1169474 RepID=A0A0G4F8K2_9ALVE|mmetsp:Transcript_56097/g.109816  ORF Transcript_56097/g.109816 Transcript_56097/m.109816 type:complete len:417 (-) Transcript_56097:245-1495(-)|eukprot:Cvel_15647.t1-p1 / transcript=Cvel_15647.t1 / gene=Cvel_15647 / organism=Chromera_velia_CCMP2878 / gene_product=hypothetical protein / transcript_product=hypothetical protein / location=Cvel_scaffold1167:29636-35833(+) / protein_length=416 / sequence_SO=supercontig / SO=protein_coding / is_pseudo=false